MAAASTLQYGRQKKSVYGKAGKSSWTTTDFFDESDDELAAPNAAGPTAEASIQRSASVKASYPVQKAVSKKATLPKTVKAETAKKDAFDVPSSDEETPPSTKLVHNPFSRAKSALVDDQTNGEADLAPWEQQRARPPGGKGVAISARAVPAATNADAQLRSDLAGVAKTVVPKRNPSSPLSRASQTQPALLDNDFSNSSSAVARLAARKRGAESNAPSTEEPAGSDKSKSKRLPVMAASEGTPCKRAKTTNASSASSVDMEMTDVAPLPLCDNSTEADIYDVPDSSADESAKPRQRSKSPRVVKKSARRSKPTTYGARATTRKGLSAPARLAEMVLTDSDVTETSAASAADSVSRGGTPRQPSTPPSNKPSSPGTTIRSGSNLTPKQAQLWSRLLPNPPTVPSPSALAMKDLTISGQKPRPSERASTVKRLTKSQPEVGRRRTRMIDRLKASAESSSENGSDESDSESDDADVAEASEPVQSKPPLLRAESMQSRTESASTSQSQARSQATVSASTGLKRTYASQRSHLAEDSIEDDLMAGLLDDTPKQRIAKPKAYGRNQTKSRKDAFDMDDSDDDGAATGGIRSIHELRAAGRHIRGTEDIEQLLEDIENHSTGHKSRQRSALIDLATKLADKNFASRFIGQGCDARLARQLNASQDDIANFVMAAAVALLLVSDPPEHTVRTLQDSALASWLGSLLPSAREISKMAKDRQYNMAKASQAGLIQLAELVRIQQSLWSDFLPAVMSTRLVALKGLDLLISKLRRTGDKSELLSPEQLPMVLQDAQSASDPELETSLAVSVLESLSTASLTLAWDAELLQRIAQTLTALDASTPRRRHTLFLTLRFCLNLTTDNARNCSLIANSHSVPYLLQSVLDGFTTLDAETEEETRTLALDVLVLALGILINLFEHSPSARSHASHSIITTTSITALVTTFTSGQQRMLEAESVAESISNVALGYLAVVLANLSQDATARKSIRDALPGRQLGLLGDAVEEFVLFHQQVDGMAMSGFEGEEGAAVWGGFTEKLRAVLGRVRGVEGEEEVILQ